MKKLFIVSLLIFFLAGCTAGKDLTQQEFEPEYDNNEVTEKQASAHSYYDFQDIPIPREMKINRDESILFESKGLKAGMLTYSGRVDSDSLFDYFHISMPNENWELLSYIKYGTQILTFAKDNRLCIIRIIEGRLRTELQIWISPKL
ncbi:hypothetical protein [Desulfonatronospira sp.]|uniref:hypothetical protein n=1 Tax=Desulfonatronospira sp. TaxID=1962951 RepID=UPI0025B82D52|nr:hypothetical protein [Desulfonatronospira sp.]